MALKKTGLFLLALSITSAILLGTNLPGEYRLMYALQDSGHFLIFASLTLFALWLYGKNQVRSIWPVMSLALLFGVAIEAVQYLIGREPSLYDILLDLLGIVAGAVLYCGVIQRTFSPHLSVLIVALLALLAFSQPIYWYLAYQVRADQFPRLINPDSFLSRAMLEGCEGGEIQPVALPQDSSIPADTAINSCVYVSLAEGPWPGVDMQEPEADWRGYGYLELAIYSDQKDDLPLTIRIHDQSHNRHYQDRYNRSLVVRPGYNHFSLPMHEIEQAPSGRSMDLSNISDVKLFASPKHIGSGFCLLAMGLR
ncbi:MAG: VanZ family protein [Candidatus Thiodiazotropha sp.]